MGFLRLIFLLVVAWALAACGGGGGSSGNDGGSGGGTSTSTAASVELVADSNTLSSADTKGVTIRAIVKNKDNNLLSGETVTFVASSGDLAITNGGITSSSGIATAQLTSLKNKSNRDIVLTATAGKISGTVSVSVTGSRLAITAGDSAVNKNGTSTYSVQAFDSAGQAVSGVAVQAVSALGGTLVAQDATTNASGVMSFVYTGVNTGTDTLTFKGLGYQVEKTLKVSLAQLNMTQPVAGQKIPVDTSYQIKISGAPLNKTVTFTTTRGVLASGSVNTGSTGSAVLTITSKTAGLATLVATISDTGEQVSRSIQFVAKSPVTMSLQATPATIQPNEGSQDTNYSTIEATVKDVNGNPVADQQVDFSTNDVVNGRLSTSAVVTDANGKARVIFYPGALTSAKDGVEITAVLHSSSSISAKTALTVGGTALFITVAPSNKLEVLDTTSYAESFVAYVTDAAGNAVANKALTLTLESLRYYKGSMGWSDLAEQWVQTVNASCDNEDLNLDGNIQYTPVNEDVNSDGILWPGGGVITTTSGTGTSFTTGSDGRLIFKVVYPKNHALWRLMRLTARASVSGTEWQSVSEFVLPILVSDVTDKTVSPPNVNPVPFGSASDCANPK